MITYPTSGTTLSNTSPRITWARTERADKYYLYVGSTPGAKDIVDSAELAPDVLSRECFDLPAGKPLYARIYARVNGQWLPQLPDISFVVATPVALGPVERVQLTNGEAIHWYAKQLVPGSNTKDPATGYYPMVYVNAEPEHSTALLPFVVPEGAWLAITYASLVGKFGNHDRTGYLVMEGVGSVVESGHPFQPPFPVLLGPGSVFAPTLINNTPDEAGEWMAVIIQAWLYTGIPATATRRDVLQPVVDQQRATFLAAA